MKVKKLALGLVLAVSAVCCVCLCACGLLHFHLYDEWVITNQATCTKSGERERYCSCGEKQTAVIGALGHALTIT